MAPFFDQNVLLNFFFLSHFLKLLSMTFQTFNFHFHQVLLSSVFSLPLKFFFFLPVRSTPPNLSSILSFKGEFCRGYIFRFKAGKKGSDQCLGNEKEKIKEKKKEKWRENYKTRKSLKRIEMQVHKENVRIRG